MESSIFNFKCTYVNVKTGKRCTYKYDGNANAAYNAKKSITNHMRRHKDLLKSDWVKYGVPASYQRHAENKNAVKCPLCAFESTSKESLRKHHIKNKHPEYYDSANGMPKKRKMKDETSAQNKKIKKDTDTHKKLQKKKDELSDLSPDDNVFYSERKQCTTYHIDINCGNSGGKMLVDEIKSEYVQRHLRPCKNCFGPKSCWPAWLVDMSNTEHGLSARTPPKFVHSSEEERLAARKVSVRKHNVKYRDKYNEMARQKYHKSRTTPFGKAILFVKQHNPKRAWYDIQEHCSRRGITNELQEAEFYNMVKDSACYYCGSPPRKNPLLDFDESKKLKSLHEYEICHSLDRINNFLPYKNDNVVVCCSECNRMKWSHTLYDFFQMCINIAAHSSGPDVDIAKEIRDQSFVYGKKSFKMVSISRASGSSYKYCQDKAVQRNIKFDLSSEEYNDLSKKPCHYCGIEPDVQYPNGIDRIDNNQHYSKDNTYTSCYCCNLLKNIVTVDVFISKAIAIAKNHIGTFSHMDIEHERSEYDMIKSQSIMNWFSDLKYVFFGTGSYYHRDQYCSVNHGCIIPFYGDIIEVFHDYKPCKTCFKGIDPITGLKVDF